MRLAAEEPNEVSTWYPRGVGPLRNHHSQRSHWWAVEGGGGGGGWWPLTQPNQFFFFVEGRGPPKMCRPARRSAWHRRRAAIGHETGTNRRPSHTHTHTHWPCGGARFVFFSHVVALRVGWLARVCVRVCVCAKVGEYLHVIIAAAAAAIARRGVWPRRC